MRGTLQGARWNFLGLSLGLVGIYPFAKPNAAAADTTVSWNNANGGNWSTAANWSPATVPDNNVPSGVNYIANISLAAPSPYMVSYTSNSNPVDQLTIGSSNATLNIESGSGLAVNSNVSVNAGTLELTGGNISGGTISVASGATLNLSSGQVTGQTLSGLGAINDTGGTLSGLTIATSTTVNIAAAGTLTMAGSWTNSGAIAGNNATLNLGGNFTPSSIGTLNLTNSSINLTGQLTLASNQTFDPNSYGAPMVISGAVINGTIQSASPVSVTIGQLNNLTIGTATTINASGNMQLAGTAVTNNGTLAAQGASATVNASFAGTVTNNGTMQATQGGTVSVDTKVYNYGSITLNAATLSVSGQANLVNETGGTISGVNLSTMTLQGGSNFGTINVNDSAASMPGTVANAPGATINVTNGGTLTYGTQPLNDGTIHLSNGTIDTTAGVRLAVNDGTLSGSGTINGDVTFANSNNGHLSFTIGGATQSTSYDFIDISGGLMLTHALLNLSIANNYGSMITPGEQFVVMDASNGIGGSFANVPFGGRLTTSDGSGSFEVDEVAGGSGTQIVLDNFQSVPEPTSAAALLTGGTLILARRRRSIR